MPLSEVVGRHVIWDKRKTNRAKRDFWACCPFHGEKTPSFHVDDRRGIYHCFGCGKTGDHFRFLTEKAGRDFPEAVKELAESAGVPLPKQTPEEHAQAVRRFTLVEANEAAAKWFQAQLRASASAMSYVLSRGITHEEIATFRLGFAPGGNALRAANLGAQQDMLDAGLFGKSEDGRIYDWFRDRIMFPIMDVKGRAVGFSGRTTGADPDRKYLNTPETPIFQKGAILYNGGPARAAAWDGAQLVAVEGNVDVIAACRVQGLTAAAPLGTALTENHVALMAKATDTAVLCFDGDPAGRKAANRAIDLILPVVSPAFTAKFAQLPDGQDPDTMVKRSPEMFRRAIDGAVTLVDMLWRRETSSLEGGPEQRAKVEGNLRKALQTIKDQATRRAYAADIKDRLDTLGARPKLYRSNSYSNHSTSPAASRLLNGFTKPAGFSLREAIVIGAIAAAPQTAVDVLEALVTGPGLSDEATSLVGKLVMALAESPDRAVQEVVDGLGLTDVVEDAIGRANAAGVALQLGADSPQAVTLLRGVVRH